MLGMSLDLSYDTIPSCIIIVVIVLGMSLDLSYDTITKGKDYVNSLLGMSLLSLGLVIV